MNNLVIKYLRLSSLFLILFSPSVSHSQMNAVDRSALLKFFVGADQKRFWTATTCDDPNGSFTKYELVPDKPFFLYLKRTQYKSPPREDMKNVISSGFSTIRKVSGSGDEIVISTEITARKKVTAEAEARGHVGLEEKASGVLKLSLSSNPSRLDIVDYFIADPRNIGQKPPYQQYIKGGVWIEGPRVGSKPAPSIACD